MKNLTIEFDNEEARKHFVTWLCEAGEQDYWAWMEIRELEEDGPITATNFIYHDEDKNFREDLIKTECGRMYTENPEE